MADRVQRAGLVTGGAQGIGKAVARRLLEDGVAFSTQSASMSKR